MKHTVEQMHDTVVVLTAMLLGTSMDRGKETDATTHETGKSDCCFYVEHIQVHCMMREATEVSNLVAVPERVEIWSCCVHITPHIPNGA